MPVVVRSMRVDEGRVYLEIVNSAIRGLARTHYPSEALDGWVVAITDDTLADFAKNADDEVRLIAELDGHPVGIGALVLERSELRACYACHPLPDGAVGRHWFMRLKRSPRRTGSFVSNSSHHSTLSLSTLGTATKSASAMKWS